MPCVPIFFFFRTRPPPGLLPTIRRLAKRATPTQMSTYNHALQLYKLFNSNNMTDDWLSLHFQQNFNGKEMK